MIIGAIAPMVSRLNCSQEIDFLAAQFCPLGAFFDLKNWGGV